MTLEEIANKFPVGTPVRYFPMGDDIGEHVDTVVRSEPWTLGQGDIVIKVDGKSGGVSTEPHHLHLLD